MEKLNTAVIGAGSHAHFQMIKNANEMNFVAVCDIDINFSYWRETQK
jgi:predicted dehydrogenase